MKLEGKPLQAHVLDTGRTLAAHGIAGPMVSQSPLTARAPKSFMDDVVVPIYNIAVQRMKEDKLTYDPALKQRYKLGDVVHAGRGTFDYYVNNCSPMQSQTSLLYVTTAETPPDTLRANVAKYGFDTDDRKARALAEQELLIDAATSEVDADNESVLRVDFGARDDQETAVELYSPVRLLRTGSGAYDGRVKFEIVNRTTNSGP